MKHESIILRNRDRKEVERFADARCGEDQSLYKKRGGFKREDIVIGALAELAVYRFLKNQGFKVKRPDFTIHTKDKKSFNADLTDGNKHFHVKGQSINSAIKYGNSWLMQRSDKLTKEPELNHYLVPTEVNLRTLEVKIFGFPSFTALHHYNVFMDCKVEWFNKSKCAIYLDALAFLSLKARWGMLKNYKD